MPLNEPIIPFPPADHKSEPDIAKSATTKGVMFQFVASLMFALMSACVYAAHLSAPDSSSLLVSFVRALVNLILIVIPAFLHSRDWHVLIGDGRKELWLRGFFGGGSLILSFAGTQAIGMAESGFLHASNAFFVAALAPFLLGQRNSPSIWITLLISAAGMYLLLEPRFDDAHHLGRAAAFTSGFMAAVAYVMIARAGKSNSPTTIVFYFTLVATLLHVVLLPFDHSPIPNNLDFWALAIAAGAFATFAQYFMTRAYQLSPAVINAIVGYASPVFGLLLSILLFGKHPDGKALIGAVIIIGCGMALPLIRGRFFRGLWRSRGKRFQ
jgi:S-adenosylmethionine uptake transporter